MKICELGLKRSVVPRSAVSPMAAERGLRFAQAIFLAMQFAVAPDDEFEVIGQRVDDGDADAVQAAGDLVGAVVEFSAGVQHGHDDFGGGAPLFGMDIHRNSAAVVRHGHRFVGMDRDHHAVAMPGQCLVDGVVHDLENHVVQAAAVIGVADVHSGAFSDGVEAF